MRRRQLLYGVGGLAGAGSLTFGTGAFTSVRANRTLDVQVADDGDALLRIAPCDGPNGDYVTTDGGQARVDLSASNDAIGGDGVNADAKTVLHDVFAIENLGTQPVGVWLDAAPVDNGRGDPAVTFYRGDDPDVGIVGVDSAVCLDVGESVCVGFTARTYGMSTGDRLLDPVVDDRELVIHADATVGCSTDGGSDGAAGRRLDTGVAGWQVVDGPGLTEATPYPARSVDPPDVWVAAPSDARWVDPFGTGGLDDDPADEDRSYVYELEFHVDEPTTLVVEGYASDNPVDLYLDDSRIAGIDVERAFETLRDGPTEQVDAGSHVLRAEVTNLQGSGGNPTGLLVAARLE